MVPVIRILLVDDFKPWRAALRSMVEAMEGFRVVSEAGNGLEAIEKAGQLRPNIVLLDIGLPQLNGIEAAPRIRRASPGSKIIFLTQEHDSDIRAAAFATGAEAFLLKSSVVRELRHALDAARQIPTRRRLRKHLETPHPDPELRFQEPRLEIKHHSERLAATHPEKPQMGG
jgi:DNA-binding NarL/FixJ family response regulator